MTGKKQYQDLVNKLIARYRPDVRVSKMYGISVMTVRGVAFAGLNRDDMVFRLGGAAHDRALALKGSKTFVPKDGRSMPGWVQVTAVQVGHWGKLADEAMDYANQRVS
jgi:hypothetical protein